MAVLSACGHPDETVRTLTPPTQAPSDALIATATPPPGVRPWPSPIDERTIAAESLKKSYATSTALASTTGIYRYDLASRTLTRVSTARAHGLAWLPDGQSIWYTTTLHPNGRGEIRQLDLGTDENSGVFPVDGGWVELAPGSGRAVFSRFRHGEGGYSVMVVDKESSERDLGEGSDLALSPDGSMLSYVSPSCGDRPMLKVADLTDGRPVAIPEIAAGRSWWLPDGRIALSLGGATSVETVQWRILDVRTGAMTSLRDLVGDSLFSDIAFSPDMKHVVLSLYPNGKVLVRDVGARTETSVPLEPGFGVV